MYKSLFLMWVVSLNSYAKNIWNVDVPISVEIHKSSSSLEMSITANKMDFLLNYDQKNKEFIDLNIPFEVVANKGAANGYEISLDYVDGQCMEGAQTMIKPSVPFYPSILLDGKSLTVNTSPILYPALTAPSIERQHMLLLSFPTIPQKDVDQFCQGRLAMTSALKI